MKRTASVLAVGSELTGGAVQDVHGRFLGRALSELGFVIRELCQVPDLMQLICDSLRRLARENDLLIITGGLGPTADDLTREAIAESAGLALEFNEQLWHEVRAAFHGPRVAESNRRQAELPDGFRPLSNLNGTAPGLLGEIDGAVVIALPGPPRELVPMVDRLVLPELRARFDLVAVPTLTATSFLIPESVLEEGLQTCAGAGVLWSTRAQGTRIVFSLRGGAGEGRRDTLTRLQDRFGYICIRPAEVSAQAVLSTALRDRGLRLVSAESCTGGLIAKMMTDIAGSSELFWGGLVTYANEAKSRVLGVTRLESDGAVSEAVVSEMASGALEISDADIAVSVSGIAGPGGGTAEKPVGTVWIGVAARAGDRGIGAWRFQFQGTRDSIRARAAVAALLIAESWVTGKNVDKDRLWHYI